MTDPVRANRIRPTRRQYLLGGGVAFTTALAGCLGDDESQPGDDGNGGDGGDGGDGTSGDDDPSFPDWDPNDPQFPQLVSTLLADDFHIGTEELLGEMEPRDEPRYGNAPMEPPEDESEWLDPDTLDFSLVPTEDPDAYTDVLEPLIDNIEAETGRDVVVNPLDSYAAQVEAMNAERLHVAGFATGATAFAVNIAGAVPFGIQIADGQFGYRLWVITQADSDVDSLDDMEGRSVTHVEESSNSGHQAPAALFTAAGVEPGEAYDVSFSGSHENSIRAIAAGDYDAAPIASTVLQRQVDAGHVDADEIKVVWASDPFPTTSFCHHYKLTPELREGIVAAHLEYDYAGTALDEYFGRDRFAPIDYATHWDVILEIQEQNGVDYRTEEI